MHEQFFGCGACIALIAPQGLNDRFGLFFKPI